MQIDVVTSVNNKYWAEGSKINVSSWDTNLPKWVKIHVYHEDPFIDKKGFSERVIFHNLYESSPELLEFIETHKDNPLYNGTKDVSETRSFKWNAIKFAHKTFAIFNRFENTNTEYLIWIDADMLIHNYISRSFLKKICNKNISVTYLGRPTMYSECGFVVYNISHPVGYEFVKEFKRYYVEDELKNISETHDSFVFDEVRKNFEQDSFYNMNSAADDNKHPVTKTMLYDYMVHTKGKDKIRQQLKFAKRFYMHEITEELTELMNKQVVRTDLPEHLGGHANKTHLDEGALDWAIKSFGIESYLDIGCGPGGMVELAESKNLRVLGVDGDYTLKRYSKDNFLIHDYTKGPAPVVEDYDLAWSVEFLEHVEEQYMPNYMETFQKAKYVIITYAPPGWEGHHHVNLQEEDYWIAKFEEYGFTYDEFQTKKLRTKSTMNLNKKARKAFVKNRGLFFRK